MATKKEKKDSVREKSIKKKSSYNLAEVIVIMIITAICTITVTIRVVFKINNTSEKIKSEAELSELIDVYNSIKNDYFEEVDKKELITAAIDGMLDVLDDPYTVLLSETETENMNKELDGEYIGLGAEIMSYTDGTFVINKVYENSPAYKAGIKAKDQLLKIGEDKLTGLKLDEVAKKLKVSDGTKIKVVVMRDKKELVLDVTIGKVQIPSVTYELTKKDDKNIALLKITAFAKNTAEQFKTISKNFDKDKIDGIIIDLRGNTGGHLAVAQSIAEMFLYKGDIIYKLSSKDGIKEVKNTKDKTIKQDVVVLVNEQTASASEILTAALRDNLNVEVVGTKTYGKGKVQKYQTLPSGNTVKYTIQNWLTPKGEEIDKNGIVPTTEVKLSEEYKKNPIIDNDNQYKKALEIITNQKK